MKILIVDDSVTNRFVMANTLKEAGYEVVEAEHGAEGLQKLRSEKVDMVISDLLMPQLDGFQFCHTIKSDPALSALPVLICTATYTDTKDELLARNLGADGFITKYASAEEFLALVATLMDSATQGTLARPSPEKNEPARLREYNERLVRKLEDKLGDVEKANQRLAELNATLEQRVEAGLSELREANRELEAFAYSVAHDVRAPLRTIQAFSNMLLNELQEKLEPKHRGFIQRIVKNARDLDTLTADLLAYSRMKTGQIEIEKVSLDPIIAAALDALATQIQETRATVEVHPPLLPVLGSPILLRQVLTNLLSNGMKYVGEGIAPRLGVSSVRKKDRVRISIQDNGIGIAPENQTRIFKVFERIETERSYPGTGVGLAIVEEAIRKMGGSVHLQSEVGKGSTFSIELPGAGA